MNIEPGSFKHELVPACSTALDRNPSAAQPPEGSAVSTDAAPSGDLENQVAGWFCDILGIHEIALDQNFLDAGGNSLMAMQVISRIKKSRATSISIKDFFAEPTVRGVAKLLSTTPQQSLAGSGHDIPAAGSLSSMKPSIPDRPKYPRTDPAAPAEPGNDGARTMKFGLFFFAGDEGVCPKDRYRVVMDAAQFADEAGFASIWIPERHFNKFGGLYPNPAVIGAAIAASTRHIHIRGGSVVAPLHHPVRIAEEWSVVDNLSHGRVGIAFGSGFHPRDFILAPDVFHDRKDRMFAAIGSVRKLWRGGSYRGVAGSGAECDVEIFPRPYSTDLPIWLSTTRDPETFVQAGQVGAGVLTALLRLSIPELAERIQIYRDALQRAGHNPEVGKVTVMLHTFLAPTIAEAKSKVLAPLKEYLRSHMELTRTVSHEKAYQNDELTLAAEEEEALIEHALERYLNTSSLIGTETSCSALVAELQKTGVDEIACLVDFGVKESDLMSSLIHLGRLHSRIRYPATPDRPLPVWRNEGNEPPTAIPAATPIQFELP